MRTISFVLLFTICTHCFAQAPEYIYGFAIQRQSADWYREQTTAWKKELDRNRSDGYAWYNYYRATRNLLRTDTTDSRSFTEKAMVLESIITEMEKTVPQSFEYNLCKWMNGGNDFEHLLPYLKKAASLGPERKEILSEMIVWAEAERDLKKRDTYSRKWYESEMASPGLLYYNYNSIIGLKPNAILLTAGDNDSYPVWILQSLGIRRDIIILNTSLIRIDSYRKKVFNELGIGPWDMEDIGKDTSDKETKINNRFNASIIKHIAANSQNRTVYVAVTIPEDLTTPVADKLYLAGLNYEYSEKNIDNLAILRKNIEQHFALDYIDKPFFKDISVYYTQYTNANYIVPMLKLYDHYKESGETQKTDWMRKKLTELLKSRPAEEAAEMIKYLNK